MKVPENDITAITVFRSMGISPAFKSALWEKYALGKFFSVSDPKTGKPSIRNFTNIPQKGDLPAGGTVGIFEDVFFAPDGPIARWGGGPDCARSCFADQPPDCCSIVRLPGCARLLSPDRCPIVFK